MRGVQPPTDEVPRLAEWPLLAQLIVRLDGVPRPTEVVVDRRRRACARQKGTESRARFTPLRAQALASPQHAVEVAVQGGEQDLVLDREPDGPGIAAALRNVDEPPHRV